jgi:lipopolysaccharide/colanic/teichoic acid biosynthesis glycosyltransferase
VATQTAPLASMSANQGYLRAKRLLDLVFTLLILIPLCLVVVIVGIAIRLDSAGPIFFRQKRVGLNGEEFTMYKFRSMYVNGSDKIHQETITRYINGEKLNDQSNGNNAYKLENDPRITRVGRIIRKTSIDELPQFFNVLRGEMSLVGPRPPIEYETRLYSQRAWLRLSGKPGLTGPWQVYGRSVVPFDEMVEMDISYLQRQSIREDLKLIVMTVPVMLLARGGV